MLSRASLILLPSDCTQPVPLPQLHARESSRCAAVYLCSHATTLGTSPLCTELSLPLDLMSLSSGDGIECSPLAALAGATRSVGTNQVRRCNAPESVLCRFEHSRQIHIITILVHPPSIACTSQHTRYAGGIVISLHKLSMEPTKQFLYYNDSPSQEYKRYNTKIQIIREAK